MSGVGGVAAAPPGGSASSVNYRLPLLWRPAAGGGSLCIASCASSGSICSLTEVFTGAAAPERGATSKGGGGEYWASEGGGIPYLHIARSLHSDSALTSTAVDISQTN